MRLWNRKKVTTDEQADKATDTDESKTNSSAAMEAEPEVKPPHLEQYKETAPKIYDALQLIRQYSPLGKRVVNWAEESHITFEEKKLKGWGLCTTSRLDAIVSVDIENEMELNISVLTHEIMHALQGYVFNLLQSPSSWDSPARILHDRAAESGAETLAIKVCHEMKQNGYAAAFDYYSKSPNNYSILFEVFENSYDITHKKDNDKDHAIQQACDDTYHAYYKNQPIIDLYNRGVLKKYIEDIIKGHTYTQTAQTGFGAVGARELTKLSDDEYFISEVNIDPSDTGLYGNNTEIRQAFEYVEYKRLQDGSSDTNFGTQRALINLKKDNNPYIGVDLNQIIDVYNSLETDTYTPNIISIMNETAKILSKVQLTLDFSNVTEKIPAQANDNQTNDNKVPSQKPVACKF